MRDEGTSPPGALLTLSVLEAGGPTVREQVDLRERGELDLEETLRLVGS